MKECVEWIIKKPRIEIKKEITIKDIAKLLDIYYKKYEIDLSGNSILYFFDNDDKTRIEIGDDKKSVSFLGRIIGDLKELEKRL